MECSVIQLIPSEASLSTTVLLYTVHMHIHAACLCTCYYAYGSVPVRMNGAILALSPFHVPLGPEPVCS